MLHKPNIPQILLTALLCVLCQRVDAQVVAVENNLVFDAFGSLSAGVQVAPSQRNTFGVYGVIRPWAGKPNSVFKMWMLEAQYRRWLCTKFNGFYYGPYVHGGEYNIANKKPFGLLAGLVGNRYQGWYVGGGLGAGYHYPINKNWNIGAEIGLGLDYVVYYEYKASACSTCKKRSHLNYFGINKLGLDIVYVIPRGQSSRIDRMTREFQIPDLQAMAINVENANNDLKVVDAKMEHVGNEMRCSIALSMTTDIPSNHSVILHPVLSERDGVQQKQLPDIFINGRKQDIYFERELKVFNPDALSVRKMNGDTLHVDYRRSLPYEPWMDNSILTLHKDNCGCTVTKPDGVEWIAENVPPVTGPIDIFPVYEVPKAEKVKVRHEQGKAFVCFVLDKIDIRPRYLTNERELNKIISSIKKVKDDEDVEIQHIYIEGYASPEGKEPHNQWLSDHRMLAIKNYIQKMPEFKNFNIESAGMGENWIGYIECLDTLDIIPQRDILKTIAYDKSLSNDEKERRMRKEAPQGFNYVLKYLFPWLRCTNYNVEYIVKPFTVEQSEVVFETNPAKLSVEEIYRIVEKYADDKEKVNAILEKAYRYFPDDSSLNMTMAYFALNDRNADDAELYLSKVQDSPVKDMNLAVLAVLRGDNETALKLLEKADAAGLKEAKQQIEEINKRKSSK